MSKLMVECHQQKYKGEKRHWINMYAAYSDSGWAYFYTSTFLPSTHVVPEFDCNMNLTIYNAENTTIRPIAAMVVPIYSLCSGLE